MSAEKIGPWARRCAVRTGWDVSSEGHRARVHCRNITRNVAWPSRRMPGRDNICRASGAGCSPSRFVDAERKQKLLQALPRIETLMSDQIKEMGIPGLAYGIVIDDEVVLAKGLGLRDVTTGAPVDADTVFRIASMTKSFTALAILKLRDAGKLSLDDPVGRYVPEVGTWQLPTNDSGPITIRHLLSHTAGLPEDNPQGDRVLDMTPEGFSAWLKAGIPFASATGSEFEYSNLGFMILGSVVTRVSGRPFQTYVTEEILLPLGMRSTYWSLAAVPKDRLAHGYRKDKESLVAEPMLEDGAGAAMGGLMTSSRDLARYVAMMLSAYPARDELERAPALRRTLREMRGGYGIAGGLGDSPTTRRSTDRPRQLVRIWSAFGPRLQLGPRGPAWWWSTRIWIAYALAA